MERCKIISLVCLLAVGLLCSTALSKPASVLLREALYAEQVEGDLDAAIKIYEQIIKDSSAQRSHVAQAVYRQGLCYYKKQDETRARAAFERLTSEYSDQTNLIEKVQPLLEELSNPDPALLMPPDTLVYVEFGSPGKQVETILKMLQGTPFENPLAAVGGQRQQSQQKAGQRSPGDIVAALLNPSMMAEFKKIKGMAIGVTGIAQNNPPCVVVMYPGKSDALRGIVLGLLGVVAQPGEPIEGMETLRIENMAGVAHDDRVIIIAQPLDQLAWCVKQYKGVTNEPTFASDNRYFAKVSRQARQENALTIWANVDEVYAGLITQFPQGELPREIRLADALADFENIDDMVAFLSIEEDGITLEENIAFKDGHTCLAYDLIRTPNLTRDGFQGVPADATALISVALAEPDGPGVTMAQKTVRRLTGLDIGREIFANMEQITIFATPPAAGADTSGPPSRMASCLGLAMTSHNPQQTHQLLGQLLRVADVMAVSAGLADASPTASIREQAGSAVQKYVLALGKHKQMPCYVGQSGKTTVLAFTGDVLERSLEAIKNGESALQAGPLQRPLSQMAPNTSKAVVVNVGGAIRLFDTYIQMAHDNPHNPVHKTLAQLAQACERTSVQVRTGESVNEFSLHAGIDNLPPLDGVFPMLIQLSEIDFAAKAKATEPQPSSGAMVGLKEDMTLQWKPGVQAVSHKVYLATRPNELSLLAEVSRPDELKLPSLSEGTSYYWRIDEVWSDGTVITGDVWNFTVGKQVAWWRLDEQDGTAATDSAGDNDGKLVGDPAWRPTDGKVGGALEFDGDGDYVEIADGSDFDITQQITVAAWTKVNAFDKSWQAIVTKGDNSWRLQRDQETDGLEFACSGATVPHSRWGDVHGTVNVNDGQWRHTVGVYDGDKLYLYVDGALDASVAATGKINLNDYPVLIGENAQMPGRFWNGLIDDVRIYNYALSQDEISALCQFNASNPQPPDEGAVRPSAELKLSWRPGAGAVSHKVYFGTSSHELSLLATVEAPSFDQLPPPQRNTEYYWRVDEVQQNGPVIAGPVWTFNTGKLIRWWKLDGNPNDSCPSGKDGTVQGDPQWVNGRIGGALRLDGTDDYVETGDTTNLPVWTIAVWVNSPAAPVSAGPSGPVHRDSNYQINWDHQDGNFRGAAGVEVRGTWYAASFGNLQADTWYHLAATYDGENLKAYKDGVLVTDNPDPSGNPEAEAETLKLGRHAAWTAHFNGTIDDVRIYNYALTKEEIAALTR